MFEAASGLVAAILKVGVPLYLAAFIASGVSLFMSDKIAQTMGIAGLRQAYRPYLGCLFIVSTSLLVASVLSSAFERLKKYLSDRRASRQMLETLSMLTAEEKQLLETFIVAGRNTVYAQIDDGITGGLAAKNIVYRTSKIFRRDAVPYNLQPIARKILTRNPGLLE